jgi:hypothetical protein
MEKFCSYCESGNDASAVICCKCGLQFSEKYPLVDTKPISKFDFSKKNRKDDSGRSLSDVQKIQQAEDRAEWDDIAPAVTIILAFVVVFMIFSHIPKETKAINVPQTTISTQQR